MRLEGPCEVRHVLLWERYERQRIIPAMVFREIIKPWRRQQAPMATLRAAERVKAAIEEISGCTAQVCIGEPGVVYGTVQLPMPDLITVNIGYDDD